MLMFPNIVPPRFIYEYLPTFIYNSIVYNNDTHKFDAMDEYLKELGINQSTVSLIKLALNNLKVREVNGEYIIKFDTIQKINGYTLEQLMRLIDSGNTEVKGTNVFENIIKYINSHRGTIIEDYMERY